MHAMWNAGTEPGRIVEIITPGGFENYFRERGSCSSSTRANAAGQATHETAGIRPSADQVWADLRDPGLDGRHQRSDTA